MAYIPIDEQQVIRIRALAKGIADEVQSFINQHTTVSVERTILRLIGVDGVTSDGVPLPNRILELLKHANLQNDGITRHFAKAMLTLDRDVQATAELIAEGNYKFDSSSKPLSEELIQSQMQALGALAVKRLDDAKVNKDKKKEKWPMPPNPWKYIIVATGNIYEDRTQARAAVEAGADIVAVIRTTAQSLLDYIPYGATTEGFGGTYATQANFKIMREALDEECARVGRYIQLTNYSSGLCMAEIAASAALESLDMLLNDSMYGILFRDINMKRTFVDQYFSRLICSRSKIIINTGEDNYLTTADAITAAHTVVASQFINEAMALSAKLPEELMGLGHAFEINPKVENAFLYELSHAQLVRQLFPKAPLKYMPPTKYKSTDVFFSHAMDTMFNLASITTKQGIHLTGILTEANHTPLMQDRDISLSSVNYVFNIAKDLGDEIEFKKDGLVAKRAATILNEVETCLKEVQAMGLMQAISKGIFADIKRTISGGKGLDGVYKKSEEYKNPIMDILGGV